MKARVAVLILSAIAVAGCSSSSSGGPPTSPPTNSGATTSASPSTSPSATTSSSSTPRPTPSFSSTVQASHRCLTSELRLSLGQAQGAAGSSIMPIVFTNTGTAACTLYGYPGVTFLDASGSQLGSDATHDGAEAAVVTLAPNGTANAMLRMPDPGNYSAGGCQPAQSARLRVYPPGDFKPLTVAYATTVCTTKNGWSSVSPVTPGTGG